MSQIDLHVHSTASDGRFAPAEIISKAAGLGLTVMALTDHDTVDGIAPALEAARVFPTLKVIPGIEISTEMAEGEVHVLGYFIDYTNTELRTALDRFRHSRETRARKMVTKLAGLGINIEWERLREIAGTGSIGRLHVAQALLEKKHISSLQEAFQKYIGHSGPAYVERDKMTPAEAVKLVLQVSGLPVLAHPLTSKDPEGLVKELRAAGLLGLEVYYDKYTAEQIHRLRRLAEKHGLIATGGSDYHGVDESNETMLGSAEVPVEVAEKLFALVEERAGKPARR